MRVAPSSTALLAAPSTIEIRVLPARDSSHSVGDTLHFVNGTGAKEEVGPWLSTRTLKSRHSSNKTSRPRSDTSTARALTASSASTPRAKWSSSAARSPPTTPWRARRPRPSTLGCASCSPPEKSITTFGPYSPGQAVAMKRMGIEGIYLGGWATSAKGSTTEDPGPDLASYPLSQVPDEAAALVRALLTADRNQQYLRLADDRGAARRRPQVRLPAVHHRRRRHRPRRRPARAQPDPALRRGRRARLPHRGPAPGHQEVRPSGRQGAGAVGRADQAPQRGPLPARHHAACRASSSPAPTPRQPT